MIWVSASRLKNHSNFIMKNPHYLVVVSLMIVVFQPANLSAQARNTLGYPADPRVAAVEFYGHIRRGEAEEAWKCWFADAPSNAKYEETLIRNTIAEWISQFRLEQAVMKKLPQLYREMEKSASLIPTPDEIAKARFTAYRRLAIIRWSDDEDAGLPLVLDSGIDPPKWKISLSHYRETTRSSVGDSFHATDMMARVLDSVTKDVLDGKVKTRDELAEAQMRYLEAQLKKAGH